MSNGGRRISASPATKKTSIAGSCHSSHHGCQASTMPVRDSVPAAIATLAAASTNGSSYASSWAAARRPPSSEYLLADAHAAMSTATTPTPSDGQHEEQADVERLADQVARARAGSPAAPPGRASARRPAPAGTPARRPRAA